MAKGTVKRWLDFRGYGFIKPDDGSRDVFVHSSELQNADSLTEGQSVEFDVQDSYKGPRATNVKVI